MTTQSRENLGPQIEPVLHGQEIVSAFVMLEGAIDRADTLGVAKTYDVSEGVLSPHHFVEAPELIVGRDIDAAIDPRLIPGDHIVARENSMGLKRNPATAISEVVRKFGEKQDQTEVLGTVGASKLRGEDGGFIPDPQPREEKVLTLLLNVGRATVKRLEEVRTQQQEPRLT